MHRKVWPTVGWMVVGALLAVGTTVGASGGDDARSQSGPDPEQVAAAFTALLEDPVVAETTLGIEVVDLATGEELFARNGDVGLVPASTTKVVTAAAALRTLGPAYQFSTHIYRDGELTPDGVLDGNLYVKGFGDPTLVVERLWKMVHDIQMEGIVEVDGDVVFDDDFFGDDHLIPGWRKKVDLANGPTYFAPLGALTLNFNTACIVIGPGLDASSPARVEFDTPAPVLIIDNRVRTAAAGARRWLRIEREVDDKAHTVTFLVEGQIPLDSEVLRYYRTVDHPTDHFMAVFAGLLKERGIKVGGNYLDGSTPEEVVLVSRSDSEPLANLLRQINKQSNNLMAEHVLKTMGAEVYGIPGTTEKGLQVVKGYLDSLGIPADQYTLVNGSGLSNDTRLRPSLLTAVMVDMYHDRRLGPEFLASLSIGGVDGTLWRRFREPDEAGRVRGKTGSINGVHCLTGILEASDGTMVGFAVMLNDLPSNSWPAKKVEDGLVKGLLHLGEVPVAIGTTAMTPDDPVLEPSGAEP